MSYLDKVRDCNNACLDTFIPLLVAGATVGRLTPEFAEHLAGWPGVFQVSEHAVAIHPGLNDAEARTSAVAQVTNELVRAGIIDRHHGERYPASAPNLQHAAFLLDRAAAPYFGIRAVGQHINGFVRDAGELKLWVGRRSRSKPTFPGKLDNMVAGGLPHGISSRENLLKECREEADITATLAGNATPVGAISYCAQTPRGLKPDILLCYDLELPSDFQPRCNDDEVEAFFLWPVEKVAQLVCDTDAFKSNCSLVIIHFLIRHGYISPEHPDYLALCAGLNHWLEM